MPCASPRSIAFPGGRHGFACVLMCGLDVQTRCWHRVLRLAPATRGATRWRFGDECVACCSSRPPSAVAPKGELISRMCEDCCGSHSSGHGGGPRAVWTPSRRSRRADRWDRAAPRHGTSPLRPDSRSTPTGSSSRDSTAGCVPPPSDRGNSMRPVTRHLSGAEPRMKGEVGREILQHQPRDARSPLRPLDGR